MTKPKIAADYNPDSISRVRRILLLIASKLGDLMDDIVVVGGLVPYLIVEQKNLSGQRRHVGTMDIDLGLSLAILEEDRYREVSDRLRAEGFNPEVKIEGTIRRQTWAYGEGHEKVTVDFLIQPNEQGASPGKLTQIEKDLAAVTVAGLDLAFKCKREVSITDKLPNGGILTRSVNVCGPAAFVVLKAKAFRLRGENKDAYDLFYLLRELTAKEVAKDFHKLDMQDENVLETIKFLNEDFIINNGGRAQVSEFLIGQRDEGIEAEVLAQIQALLRALEIKK